MKKNVKFTLKNKILYMLFVTVIVTLIIAVVYIFDSASKKRKDDLRHQTKELSENISKSLQIKLNEKIFIFKNIIDNSNLNEDERKTFYSTLFESCHDLLFIQRFDSSTNSIFMMKSLNSPYISDCSKEYGQLFSFNNKHIFVNLKITDGGLLQLCVDSQAILENSANSLTGEYCVWLKHQNSKTLAHIGVQNSSDFVDCKFSISTTNQFGFITSVSPGLKELKEITYTPLSAMFIVSVIFCMGIALLGMYILQTTLQEKDNHTNQLKNLTGQALNRLEDERTRISRILHDDIGHDLTMALMSFDYDFDDMLNEKDSFYNGIDHIREGLRKTRQFCRSLQPPMIEDVGWEEVVNDLVDKTTSTTGILFKTKFVKHDIPLTKEYQTTIYRIIREAITNIVKYSDASIVEISSLLNKKNLVITIHDNGKGFDVKKNMGKGVGLVGMQERCENMNAELSITSNSKNGTTITITI